MRKLGFVEALSNSPSPDASPLQPIQLHASFASAIATQSQSISETTPPLHAHSGVMGTSMTPLVLPDASASPVLGESSIMAVEREIGEV